MAGKVSWNDFLKQHNENQKKMQEMRNANRKGGKSSFQKPKPFSMRMKYWKPNDTPTWVRLVPYNGQDDAYFEYYQTWTKVAGKPRSLMCNCKGRQLEVPCVPCYYAIKDDNTTLVPSRRDALTVNVLEHFHKVKKQGRKNEYTVYERCRGVDRHNKSACEFCDAEIEKVYANKYYWSLGYGHKLQLEEKLDAIAQSCASCKEGEISVYGYACSKCGATIASHKDSNIDEAEEEILRTADDICCPECDHEGRTSPLIECVRQDGHGSSARWVQGCDSPAPIENVYDLEFLISTTGSGNATSIQIEDWRRPTEELKSWQLEPMDFPYFLAYQDLDDQATAMGRDNPFDEDVQKILEDYYKKSSDTSDEAQAESY